MDYDDIEWEESNNDNSTTTTTNTSSFNESMQNEFKDDTDKEEEENNDKNDGLDTDQENDENQDEEDGDDAIEFEIDTNEFKSKEPGKKRVVKKVDLKEKHNCLYLHRTVLTCYLANFKYTIKILSNEYLNSIVLSFIPKDLINLYSNQFKTTEIVKTPNDQTPPKSRSRSKSKSNNTTTTTTITTTNIKPSIPFMTCINEIIKWFFTYFKIDEMVDNSNSTDENNINNKNNKKKNKTREIINLDDDNENTEEKKKEKKLEPKNSLLYYQLITQIKERKVTKKIFVELFYMVCLILGYKCRIVRPLLTTPPVPVTPSKLKRIVSSSSPQAFSKSKSRSSPSIIRLNYNDDDDNNSEDDKEIKVKKSKSSPSKTKTSTTSSTTRKKINDVITSKDKKEKEKKEKEKEREKEREREKKKSRKKSPFSFDSTDSDDNDDDDDDDEEEEELIISKPITSRQKSIQANQFKKTILNSNISKKKETTMSKKRKSNSSLTSKNKKNDTDSEDEDSNETDNDLDKDSDKDDRNKNDQEKDTSNSSESDFKDSKKKLKRSSSEPIKRSRLSILDEKDKESSSIKTTTTTTTTTTSSSSSSNNNDEKVEIESWIEIFDQENNKWISIDLINREIDKPLNFEKILDPFSYVVAISKYQIKDVTSRYTNNYIGSSLKRLPIAQIKWWLQLVGDAFNNPMEIENDNEPVSQHANDSKKIMSVNIELLNNLSVEERKLIEKIDSYEKEELIIKESKLPFPTSFAQFKSHPIFVLEKDISKYCSPNPSSKPLGLFNDTHKIYHKDQIKVLHTSDKWVQNGRMVIDGQQPLKIVKGKSKSNPTSMLFGEWQTKIFEPAFIGRDGIVPANSFGNVYLFNSSMCPINGVHLRGKGLIRVAKKLGISVAPALVGWENGRRSYPIIDGVVVAKKFSKKLLDTWLTESSSRAEIELQKKNDEIKARWKRFMKKLLIKNYIEKTYNK
ncbi:hypothetical protein ACTA71_003285 [Dictyostelium dimigraforme]